MVLSTTGVDGKLSLLNKVLGILSREYRESLLDILAPIPLLSAVLILMVVVSNISVMLYLLTYSMFLSTLLIFFRRAYSRTVSSIREAREYRTPDVTGFDSMDVREQIAVSRKQFFQTNSKDIEHISEHSKKSTIPNLTYIGLSLSFTLLVWSFLTMILAGAISTGVFQSLIDVTNQQTTTRLTQAIVESSTVVFIISDFFFPNLNYESGVIVAANVIFPGIFFLTAAENIITIIEELGRRFLSHFYDANSPLRQYEAIGWALLSVVFIMTIFLPGQL